MAASDYLGPQYTGFTRRDRDSVEGGNNRTRDPFIFSDYISENKTTRGNSVRYDYYPKPGQVGASLHVYHTGSAVNYEYPRYDIPPEQSRWQRNAEEDGQIPLFKSAQIREPKSMVTHLHGTKNSRVAAMTMLGIAEEHANRERGTSLSPSFSLSPHSQRLVEHLEDLGATRMPFHVDENDLTYWEDYKPSKIDILTTAVPQADVRAGRERVRKIVGGRRSKRQGTGSSEVQYEQPTLPGV